MTTPDQAFGGAARRLTATTAATQTSAPSASATTRPVQSSVASGPRRVRLTMARVDPWSVMKLSFLLAVAVGVALVVMVATLWTILDSMGVFASIDKAIGEVLGGPEGLAFNLMDYIGFSRVLSLATVVAVLDVFLLTALSTLAAFLYNICSSLVGGLHLTLTDD